MKIPPILLVIFNRPDTTAQVFETIRAARPEKLFIAADGPRPDRPTDKELCDATRVVTEKIDWPCEVKRLYQEKNLGCKQGPIQAINWFFENVEAGIILEDDCLPDPSFFAFCAELLERYRDDTRIMHISGNNFQFGQMRGNASYYFSKYSHSWGWATWRRAWMEFAPAMKEFPTFVAENKIKSVPISQQAQKFWLKNFIYSDKNNDSWDGLWMYTTWLRGGLSILPNKNLVSNIGFTSDATHTKEKSLVANLPTETITSLTHPTIFAADYEADEYTFETIFNVSFLKKIIAKIKNIL